MIVKILTILRCFILITLMGSSLCSFSIDQGSTTRTRQKTYAETKKMLKKGGVSKYFLRKRKAPFRYEKIVTDPLFLQRVARDSIDYIDRFKNTHGHVLAPVSFSRSIFPAYKVRETLQFIVDVIEQDKKRGRFRILNPNFISKHFSCVKWTGDYQHAVKKKDCFAKKGKVRLTHYAVFQVSGSYRKTKKYCKPLFCFPYLDDDGSRVCKPLVWLTKKGHYDALMQGTIFVRMPDRKVRAFRLNLTKNMKDYKKIARKKRRYYFCEIQGKKFERLYARCIQRKGIVFAGDIYNIGIGKVIALSYRNPRTKRLEMRLGVLADTGGAFVKNLYKLDYFAGIFSSRKALWKNMKNFPTSTDTYILYKKS